MSKLRYAAPLAAFTFLAGCDATTADLSALNQGLDVLMAGLAVGASAQGNTAQADSLLNSLSQRQTQRQITNLSNSASTGNIAPMPSPSATISSVSISPSGSFVLSAPPGGCSDAEVERRVNLIASEGERLRQSSTAASTALEATIRVTARSALVYRGCGYDHAADALRAEAEAAAASYTALTGVEVNLEDI
jgi:hypothetical protein